MIDAAFARRFAEEWVAAWNAHDLDRILSHYSDDFEISSPFIPVIAGEPSGTLKGKENVRAYWKAALEKMPELEFELRDVLFGLDSIVIYYRSVKEKMSAEVLFLGEAGKVVRVVAHYDK